MVFYVRIKHGKGCINFRKKDNVDFEAVRKVIEKALDGST